MLDRNLLPAFRGDDPDATPARAFHPGMGQAVAERTVARKRHGYRISEADAAAAGGPDAAVAEWCRLRRIPYAGEHVANRTVGSCVEGYAVATRFETWGEVADRVSLGSALLEPGEGRRDAEFRELRGLMRKGAVILSGRHLQHGDWDQPDRPSECWTNCATSNSTFAQFLLLLSGAGVGRCYDDDLMLADWENGPDLRVVLDEAHPDARDAAHFETRREALAKYGPPGARSDIVWHEVEDSREGWAKAVEVYERLAWEGCSWVVLILDFSKVRGKGSPIRGMQHRPASGPVPLMNAFLKAATIRGSGLPRWLATMWVDHYFAECVLVGGARRSARMSVKHWRDRTILDFVRAKRPVEYAAVEPGEATAAFRKTFAYPPTSFLWSSNNSVVVDAAFWAALDRSRELEAARGPGWMEGWPGPYGGDAERRLCGGDLADYEAWAEAVHARRLFDLLTACAYGDGTGEPGLINGDKIKRTVEGAEAFVAGGDYVGSARYRPDDATRPMLAALGKACLAKGYFIVNPCSEIVLAPWGGFCVIGDVVPYHASGREEIESAVRATVRALIRVNLTDSLYRNEVRRTNRIGVGLTGVQEFAWKHFRVGFRDLVAHDGRPAPRSSIDGWPIVDRFSDSAADRAAAFWHTLAAMNRAARDEAAWYAAHVGLPFPDTLFTVKPAGSVSKLFGLTEGWHLASMAFYLRWVQFRNDDPLVAEYAAKGYPTRELTTYKDVTIVGFPTELEIGRLGLGDRLVCAAEATMEEQYRWVALCERYWLGGVAPDGSSLEGDVSNQASYTLKYSPSQVSLAGFREAFAAGQRSVRCCSVMPQEEIVSYEYQPEQPVSVERYAQLVAGIRDGGPSEDIGKEHVDCAGGACPIDFHAGDKATAGA